MKLPFLFAFYLFMFHLIPPSSPQEGETTTANEPLQELSAKQTSSIALIFSMIQCQPNDSDEMLGASQNDFIRANRNFNPEHHLAQYANSTEIKKLLAFVMELKATGVPDNIPFTNDPESINNFQTVLVVLWRNSQDWQLFYNTAAWLVGRANSATLFWSLMIVCAEKFPNVVVPHTAEIFPQLYIQKNWVLAAANISSQQFIPENPLSYYLADPGISDFHTHFHMEMPFWWDPRRFDGVFRHRKGELFLYMHHQLMCRYHAARLSAGLGQVESLQLDPSYRIPEGYIPDIVNVDYDEFPGRPDNWAIGDFDTSQSSKLQTIKSMYDKVSRSIEQGWFRKSGGGNISLFGPDGADIVGATIEASFVYSADYNYYGTFHNLLHSYLGGMLSTPRATIPGVESHQETAMRDRLFYQIHQIVDDLYLKYKRLIAPPYTREDLEFPGIIVFDVKILTCSEAEASSISSWPFAWHQQQTPVLTTFMTKKTIDISNAARRPCHFINEEPVPVQVSILDHAPFTYVIAVQSVRSQISYGMVRIFMWPQYTVDGIKLEGDAAHLMAIELDRFRVRILPGTLNVITRSSRDSTLTKSLPLGIKELYNANPGDEIFTRPEAKRACGFPNNLLLPKGTVAGLQFKLTVFISDESGDGEVDDSLYPHYPLCGALHNATFPDKRPMGFPFNKPGTNFTFVPESSQFSSMLNCAKLMITNMRQIDVVVKHDIRKGNVFM